jgi:F0F1-type ATP synthase assembly protein I
MALRDTCYCCYNSQKMTKAAAKSQTTTEPATDKLDQYAEDFNGRARSQFMGATLNMGWRLAITVVVPIVGGVKLDERFKSTPSLTILGLMLATVAGCVAVWSTVKEVNQEQAEEEEKRKRAK